MSYGDPSNEQLAQSAREWTERAEEHIRAAEFCQKQAARFLAHIAIEGTERPHLTLILGEG